jgi:hypothetical protein
MRTKDELIGFLHRVVGEEYVHQNGESIDIKPYTIEYSENRGTIVSGSIMFKTEVMDTVHNSDHNMVRSIIESLNTAYSQSIKDCLSGDPDMLSTYKMSKFKFS